MSIFADRFNISFAMYLCVQLCKMLSRQNQKVYIVSIYKKESIIKIDDMNIYSEQIIDDDFSELIQKNERYKLFQSHFANLGKDCQKILQLYFDKVPLKNIAQIMGFKSEKYAKKRKFKCKEYLIKSIKQDLEYKSILSGE